ncbi:MAG: hypothetical protein KKD63_14205 [Proteobacteria bacterium]|nr:hypothetical protein [Desulfobulbaceae bacterium]MBU4154022.1 hypothetical protein [Pseudomonadota bacterium]MDP2105971.1 hypothetical protein [Desulfobulbaceae bacterium]
METATDEVDMGMINQGKGQEPIPVYTKVGWVMAWVVMFVIGAMILRNCATSVIYGRKTNQQQVETYYKLGITDGTSGQGPMLRDEAVKNPVLRKAYSKGYREGVDKGRQTQISQ